MFGKFFFLRFIKRETVYILNRIIKYLQMAEITYGCPLGESSTFEVNGLDQAICASCLIRAASREIQHRGFGQTNYGGGKKKQSRSEQMIAAHSNPAEGHSYCTRKGDHAIITTNEFKTIEALPFPCARDDNGSNNSKSDLLSAYTSQLTNGQEVRGVPTLDQILAALRHQEP